MTGPPTGTAPGATSGWDGRGLPPAAQARLDRSRSSGLRTSLLEVRDEVALPAVGFEAVAEVMGSCVMHLGFRGVGLCGYSSYPSPGSPYGSFGVGVPATVTAASGERYAGYGPYGRALYAGYGAALGRLDQEAAGLGAHGVVGVHLTVADEGLGNQEFLARGTAVRALQRPRVAPARPFTCELPAAAVAALLFAGWVPTAVTVGVSVGIRHDDWRTQGQATGWVNTEVYGYTDLVGTVRAEARRQFDARVAAGGADSAVVSDLGMQVWEVASAGHTDHAAQATVVGSGLARFARRGERHPAARAVLPLTDLRKGGHL